MVLDLMEKLVLVLSVFFISLGMGATVTLDSLRKTLSEIKAVTIGLLSQYIWMPLIAFLLTIAFDFSGYIALSVILLGCVSGGAISNLFTYYSKGNVSLSIAMTAYSTFASIIMIPLLLKLYSINLEDDLVVPYKEILFSLFGLLLPVAAGMYIRYRSQWWGGVVEKIASFLGVFIILYLLLLMFTEHKNILINASYQFYLCAILLAMLGPLLGFLTSKLSKISYADAKTIAIETGIQNMPLTVGIISFSFVGNEVEMMFVPVIYGVVTLLMASASAIIFYKLDGDSI